MSILQRETRRSHDQSKNEYFLVRGRNGWGSPIRYRWRFFQSPASISCDRWLHVGYTQAENGTRRHGEARERGKCRPWLKTSHGDKDLPAINWYDSGTHWRCVNGVYIHAGLACGNRDIVRDISLWRRSMTSLVSLRRVHMCLLPRRTSSVGRKKKEKRKREEEEEERKGEKRVKKNDEGEDPGSADKEGISGLSRCLPRNSGSGARSALGKPAAGSRQGKALLAAAKAPSFYRKRARKLAAGIYLALAGSYPRFPPSFPRGGSFPGTRAPR